MGLVLAQDPVQVRQVPAVAAWRGDGLLSAASALAVGELAAALPAVFGASAPSEPVVAVGEWEIAVSPALAQGVGDLPVRHARKTAPLTGVYVTILAVSALAGVGPRSGSRQSADRFFLEGSHDDRLSCRSPPFVEQSWESARASRIGPISVFRL